VHQGWKDSQDSVFHDDGEHASSPIALCEVQGYVFAARKAAARIARALGDGARAELEERRAEELRVKFESAFWCDDLGTYGIALDGKKRLCRVRSSNAGHCLWTGIASKERAARVAETLIDPHSFSGWGVRTIAKGTARYNPMSYHNGSIWPHDNAIVAAGLARYGHKREALAIFAAMLDATRHFELQRLPELFCGFARSARSNGQGPTLYPVACSPQAWASGAVYMLLQSVLGLSVDAVNKRVVLAYPHLPPLVRELSIDGLRVGGNACVDVTFHRYPVGVGVDVRNRCGDVEVNILK
jgi:glycogen debranching enzyme